MRNMRSHEEHEKMSSLARRLGHEAGVLAICAETRRPPGAREERREPMRAEPVKNAASPH